MCCVIEKVTMRGRMVGMDGMDGIEDRNIAIEGKGGKWDVVASTPKALASPVHQMMSHGVTPCVTPNGTPRETPCTSPVMAQGTTFSMYAQDGGHVGNPGRYAFKKMGVGITRSEIPKHQSPRKGAVRTTPPGRYVSGLHFNFMQTGSSQCSSGVNDIGTQLLTPAALTKPDGLQLRQQQSQEEYLQLQQQQIERPNKPIDAPYELSQQLFGALSVHNRLVPSRRINQINNHENYHHTRSLSDGVVNDKSTSKVVNCNRSLDQGVRGSTQDSINVTSYQQCDQSWMRGIPSTSTLVSQTVSSTTVKMPTTTMTINTTTVTSVLMQAGLTDSCASSDGSLCAVLHNS